MVELYHSGYVVSAHPKHSAERPKHQYLVTPRNHRRYSLSRFHFLILSYLS